MAEGRHSQTAAAILMVRPAGFGFNEETAETNVFQMRDENLSDKELHEWAILEFDALVKNLRAADVDVIVFEDTPEPRTPEAVFPNNWLSLHQDGTVVIYPMYAPIRRLERRPDIVDKLQTLYRFEVSRVIDLTHHEDQGKFLEGTGSVVFDYQGNCAYANISPRTDADVLSELTELLGYDLVTFQAKDAQGIDIYHTNVVMSIGEGFIIICADAIDNVSEREVVLSRLKDTGRDLVLIDRDQMGHFAGNVLEVESRGRERVLVMSSQALQAFVLGQIKTLQKHARIVTSAIPTVERVEGGSIRCMIAGIHLPRREFLG